MVERILSSEEVRSLEVIVERPNPDDFDEDAFKEVEDRLKRLNASRETVQYVAPEREFLTLDEPTKQFARVGAENGKVSARLRENDSIIPVSTAQHPITLHEMYDRDDTPTEAIFRSLTARLIGLVRENRGRA